MIHDPDTKVLKTMESELTDFIDLGTVDCGDLDELLVENDFKLNKTGLGLGLMLDSTVVSSALHMDQLTNVLLRNIKLHRHQRTVILILLTLIGEVAGGEALG